jgi:hypothetical protein
MPDVVCEGGTVGVCRHEGECEQRVEHRVEHNITEWNRVMGRSVRVV